MRGFSIRRISVLLITLWPHILWTFSFYSGKEIITVGGGSIRNNPQNREIAFAHLSYKSPNIQAGTFTSPEVTMAYGKFSAEWDYMEIRAGHSTESFEHGFMVSNRAFRYFYDTLPSNYPIGGMFTTGLPHLNITSGYFSVLENELSTSSTFLTRANMGIPGIFRISAGVFSYDESKIYRPWLSAETEIGIDSIQSHFKLFAESKDLKNTLIQGSFRRKKESLSFTYFRNELSDPLISPIYNLHKVAIQNIFRAEYFTADIFKSESKRQVTIHTHNPYFQIWWQNTETFRNISGFALNTNPKGLHLRISYYDTFHLSNISRQASAGAGFANMFSLMYLYVLSDTHFMPLDPLVFPVNFYTLGLLTDNYLYSRRTSHNVLLTANVKGFTALMLISQTANYRNELENDILLRFAYAHIF